MAFETELWAVARSALRLVGSVAAAARRLAGVERGEQSAAGPGRWGGCFLYQTNYFVDCANCDGGGATTIDCYAGGERTSGGADCHCDDGCCFAWISFSLCRVRHFCYSAVD